MQISVNPRKLTTILLYVFIALVLLSTAGQILRFATGHDVAMGFTPEFHLEGENNIPTYFSSVILFISSCIFALVARYKRVVNDHFALHWLILAVIFLFLSIDETASIHQSLVDPMRHASSRDGFTHFSWVIPGIIVVAVLGLMYLSFLLNLGSRFKLLFGLAAMVYVGGTFGVDMVAGNHVSVYGRGNITYEILVAVEESLEITGILILIYALLGYIKEVSPEVDFVIEQRSACLEEDYAFFRKCMVIKPLFATDRCTKLPLYLERQGLSERDTEHSYLSLEDSDEDPMDNLRGLWLRRCTCVSFP